MILKHFNADSYFSLLKNIFKCCFSFHCHVNQKYKHWSKNAKPYSDGDVCSVGSWDDAGGIHSSGWISETFRPTFRSLIILIILLTLLAGHDEEWTFLVRKLADTRTARTCKIIELIFQNPLLRQGAGKADVKLKSTVGIVPSYSLYIAFDWHEVLY